VNCAGKQEQKEEEQEDEQRAENEMIFSFFLFVFLSLFCSVLFLCCQSGKLLANEAQVRVSFFYLCHEGVEINKQFLRRLQSCGVEKCF